jgi:hypothetical protein
VRTALWGANTTKRFGWQTGKHLRSYATADALCQAGTPVLVSITATLKRLGCCQWARSAGPPERHALLRDGRSYV